SNSHVTLLQSSVGICACLLLQFAFRLPHAAVDLSRRNHWPGPIMVEEPSSDQGPVLVTVQYVIDPAKVSEFLNALYRYERVRRRDGATRWGIFYDTETSGVYL